MELHPKGHGTLGNADRAVNGIIAVSKILVLTIQGRGPQYKAGMTVQTAKDRAAEHVAELAHNLFDLGRGGIVYTQEVARKGDAGFSGNLNPERAGHFSPELQRRRYLDISGLTHVFFYASEEHRFEHFIYGQKEALGHVIGRHSIPS
jgi:hypothetical protein